MTKALLTIPGFSTGILGNSARGRVDSAEYRQGLSDCDNFKIDQVGSAIFRAGSQFITDAGETPSVNNTRDTLINYDISSTESYYILAEENTFKIYSSLTNALISTLVTEYSEAENRALQFARFGSILYISSQNHPPRQVTRLTTTNFRIDDLAFVVPPTKITTKSVFFTSLASGDPLTVGATIVYNTDASLVSVSVTDETRSALTPLGGVMRITNITGMQVIGVVERPIIDGSNFVAAFVGPSSVALKVTATELGVNASITLIAKDINSDDDVDYFTRDNHFIAINGGLVDLSGDTSLNNTPKNQATGIIQAVLDNDTTTTISESSNAEFEPGNYPRAIAVFKNRLFFGGTQNNTQRVWGSKDGLLGDFTIGTAADDGIEIDLVSTKAANILWLSSSDRLIAGCLGVTIGIDAVATRVFSPGTIEQNPISEIGATEAFPANYENSLFYVGRTGTRVYEQKYSLESDNVTSSNIMTAVGSLGSTGIKKIVQANTPDPTLFALTNAGIIICYRLNYRADGGAWFRYSTGGYIEDIESVGLGGVDSLVLAVTRRLGSGFSVYIESLPESEVITQNTNFLDSAKVGNLLDFKTVSTTGAADPTTERLVTAVFNNNRIIANDYSIPENVIEHWKLQLATDVGLYGYGTTLNSTILRDGLITTDSATTTGWIIPNRPTGNFITVQEGPADIVRQVTVPSQQALVSSATGDRSGSFNIVIPPIAGYVAYKVVNNFTARATNRARSVPDLSYNSAVTTEGNILTYMDAGGAQRFIRSEDKFPWDNCSPGVGTGGTDKSWSCQSADNNDTGLVRYSRTNTTAGQLDLGLSWACLSVSEPSFNGTVSCESTITATDWVATVSYRSTTQQSVEEKVGSLTLLINLTQTTNVSAQEYGLNILAPATLLNAQVPVLTCGFKRNGLGWEFRYGIDNRKVRQVGAGWTTIQIDYKSGNIWIGGANLGPLLLDGYSEGLAVIDVWRVTANINTPVDEAMLIETLDNDFMKEVYSDLRVKRLGLNGFKIANFEPSVNLVWRSNNLTNPGEVIYADGTRETITLARLTFNGEPVVLGEYVTSITGTTNQSVGYSDISNFGVIEVINPASQSSIVEITAGMFIQTIAAGGIPNPSDDPNPILEDNLRIAHLPNTLVTVKADGAILAQGPTDNSGDIYIPNVDAAAIQNIQAGIQYTGTITTLQYVDQPPFNIGMFARAAKLLCQVYNTNTSFTINGNFVPTRNTSVNLNEVPALFTGEVEFGGSGFEKGLVFKIETTQPYPTNISGLFGTIEGQIR